MANLCEVDMRLRAKKDNAFGLLNVMNALISPKDYIETHSIMSALKQLMAKHHFETVTDWDATDIYQDWFEIGSVEEIDAEDAIVIQISGVCGWSVFVSMLRAKEDGACLNELCKRWNIDFTIASEEPLCGFNEELNFIGGEMVTDELYDISEYVLEQLNQKFETFNFSQREFEEMNWLVSEYKAGYLKTVPDPETDEESSNFKICCMLFARFNPKDFRINSMDRCQRMF